MIRIRPSGEVETLSFSIRHQNSGREHLGGSGGSRVQIGGSRVQNGGSRVQMAAHIQIQISGSRVQNGGSRVQMAAHIRIQIGGSRVQILSGYVVRMLSDGVSGRLVRVYSLHRFQITLLNFRFALVIKIPKLDTFFIRIDCKGP